MLKYFTLAHNIEIQTHISNMLIKSIPAEHFSIHNKLPFLPTITFFIVLFSIFSVVAFLCATHKLHRIAEERAETVRLGGGDEKGLSKLQSNISSKALLMAKMVSWRKLQDHEEEGSRIVVVDNDDEAVWKKKIIMGERCRPLEFSGKITYDSNGNPLLDSLSNGNNDSDGK